MNEQDRAEAVRLTYSVESEREFDEVLKDVDRKIEENGFRVLFVHDVQKTMQEKGFAFERYKIVELCNAKLAYKVLQADLEIGLMLPCKINVYEKDGKRHISGMLPTLISEFFPNADLGSAPQEVEAIIKKIIDEVK